MTRLSVSFNGNLLVICTEAALRTLFKIVVVVGESPKVSNLKISLFEVCKLKVLSLV